MDELEMEPRLSPQALLQQHCLETVSCDDRVDVLLARLALVDIPMYDRVIPAGDRVVLLVGSANRDPRVFSAPDTYDLRRPEPLPQMASFGFGRHFCLGASLARLEARVALEEIVAAVADYDIDPDRIQRVHSVNVRGFASLPSSITFRGGAR